MENVNGCGTGIVLKYCCSIFL